MKKLGDYRIIGPIEEGENYSRYLARGLETAEVAIVEVHFGPKEKINGWRERGEEVCEKTASLEDPSVVALREVFSPAPDQLVLVWGHWQGMTLRDLLSRGKVSATSPLEPLLPSRALAVIIQVLGALERVQQQGIYPEINLETILLEGGLDGREKARVLTLGRTLIFSEKEEKGGEEDVFYFPPEKEESERALIYSMGMVLYTLVTGIYSEKLIGESGRHYTAWLYPPRPRVFCPHLEIPEDLEKIIYRAIQKDPSRRFSSLEAFYKACEDFQREGQWKREISFDELFGSLPGVGEVSPCEEIEVEGEGRPDDSEEALSIGGRIGLALILIFFLSAIFLWYFDL